ncbi:permease prefix domain 1-containing protein [Sphaerisporangium sp. NPDC004334]
MASASVIDDYVSTLGRMLRGSTRVRRDLLTEARDGLTDSAEAYLAEGFDRVEAERMAVAEFGPVDEIAPGYQEEIAAHQGRRTAAVLFVTVPLMTLMWSGIWKIFPENPSTVTEVRAAWFSPLARFLDLFQLGMGVLGALALLAFGGPLRAVLRPGVLTRALGILLWIHVPAICLMGLALAAGAGRALSGFEAYPPGVAASLVSYLVSGSLLWSATRCVIVSRPLPVASAATVSQRRGALN